MMKKSANRYPDSVTNMLFALAKHFLFSHNIRNFDGSITKNAISSHLTRWNRATAYVRLLIIRQTRYIYITTFNIGARFAFCTRFSETNRFKCFSEMIRATSPPLGTCHAIATREKKEKLK